MVNQRVYVDRDDAWCHLLIDPQTQEILCADLVEHPNQCFVGQYPNLYAEEHTHLALKAIRRILGKREVNDGTRLAVADEILKFDHGVCLALDRLFLLSRPRRGQEWVIQT